MIKVAQCWDDGVATDIRLTSIFRKYGAKATFNLCPGLIPEKTVMPSWKSQPFEFDGNDKRTGFRSGRVGKDRLLEVYGDFCVASHCWAHEHAEKVSAVQFIQSATDARNFLEEHFQRPCPGFAWPYGAYTDDTVKGLQDAGFAYGRTCFNSENPAAESKCPLLLSSHCHFQSGDFWSKFETAKKEHQAFFYFWGHSNEMLDSEGLWGQLEEKIAILSSDPEVQWVNVVDLVRWGSPQK